ncbi:plasmid partition protein ParG [Psychrobacter sanguinis]|uniref:Chromosome partitioning protein ParB n=1 Tax=Psychrobacter sanguinis TaxID=861445 RepID=A0A844M410_9GAMM|nr:plasmid partition protein ParG [Psychrobacter sanguinis]MUG33450.1 hypothetical protein [Psychrobacter sanguinis]
MKAGRPSKSTNNELKLSDVVNTPKSSVRVNFNLDEDTYTNLKRYALDNRTTITKLLTEMIENRLNER